MTMTITLTPEQEERLKSLAARRGVDSSEFATAVLVQAIEQAEPTVPSDAPRPFGLARGQFVVPEDFDAALPDDILADFEGRGAGAV